MKKFPDTIPATEKQWHEMYSQYHAAVEKRYRRLSAAETSLLIAGVLLLASVFILGTLQVQQGVALLAAGLTALVLVIPLSQYNTDSYIRLVKSAADSDAARYWKLRHEAESCRTIAKARKARGMDPEDDTYYENLARHYDAEADALLSAHDARRAS